MEDALSPPADASYEAQAERPYLGDGDERVAEAMVSRRLKARAAAAVRCAWDLPAVLRVDPRDRDGNPFPTMFWLSCPLAVKHVARLEAGGAMRELQARLATDEAFAASYREASESYVAARDALGGPLPGDPTAGGMPVRVKCLHVHYGHYLATGDNPVGAWVAEQIQPMSCPAPCVDLAVGRTPGNDR